MWNAILHRTKISMCSHTPLRSPIAASCQPSC
ncbi:UNVERIFIED_CONTAM: hypothetical protein GTU68_011107 [Idotea baltica]|nr:hypothetical protein [Idotea baltica]